LVTTPFWSGVSFSIVDGTKYESLNLWITKKDSIKRVSRIP